MSADGKTMLAAAVGPNETASGESYGGIWMSRDSGMNWRIQEYRYRDGWTAVACSADGSRWFAGRDQDSIFGGNFPFATEIACSADGTRLVSARGQRQFLESELLIWALPADLSDDWEPQSFYPDRGTADGYWWGLVAASADASRIIATGGGCRLWRTLDSGGHWSLLDQRSSWIALECSAEGVMVVLADADRICVSGDAGTTWTPCAIPGNGWTDVACSADGTKLVAVAGGRFCYTSTDRGLSWVRHDTTEVLTEIAMSADGTQLAATGGGKLCTASASFPANDRCGTGKVLVSGVPQTTDTTAATSGEELSILGTARAVIGAYGDDTAGDNAGSVSLFNAIGAPPLVLTSPNARGADYFGCSLAVVGGDRLLIGAQGDRTQAIAGGAAFLFDSKGGRLTTFFSPRPEPSERFGCSVAALGPDRVVIGAKGHTSGGLRAGAAYLFRTDGTPLATFEVPDPEDGDQFGISVAAAGDDRLLIGASTKRSWNRSVERAGEAYLFNTNGVRLHRIMNPWPETGDEFGVALAAWSGERVIIGAEHAGGAGEVMVYGDLGNQNPWRLFNPSPQQSVRFGAAVALRGPDEVLVGAPRDAAGSSLGGMAHRFRSGGTLLTSFSNPTPAVDDEFGAAVAAAGAGEVLIGAPGEEVSGRRAGAVHRFGTDGNWRGINANPSPEADDFFGSVLTVLSQPYLGRGVWFTFMATQDGPVSVSTEGSDFDTVLMVYSGTCEAPVYLASSDDSPGAPAGQAGLVFEGVAGTTYRILAGGYAGAAGSLRIVASSLGPSNDPCAGAIDLVAGVAHVMNTADATDTADPETLCGHAIGKGVWFKYAPVTDGWIAVETCGSDFPTVLQAFQGTCDTLVPIPCGDHPLCDDGRAALLFKGTAGTTYSILVGGRDGASGNLRIVARPLVVRTLTVSASYAWPHRARITVAPEDLDGRTDGTTVFTRHYEDGTPVNLTAPSRIQGGWAFKSWLRDEKPMSPNTNATITMHADHTLSAVYERQGLIVTWTNKIGGNWHHPTYWDPNGVPRPQDEVRFGPVSGTITVDANVEVAALTLAGGTLTGAGKIAVNGPLEWTGGAIRGTVQCQGGSVGVGTTALHGHLINSGNLIVSTPPGYGFYTGNGSVISNLAGATLAWNTDVGTTYQGGARGTIYNEGRFIKSSGAGTTAITDHFQSSGPVQVDTGTLSLATTSTLSGRCVVNGTAILDFPAGTHALAGCTLAGSGTVRFSGGRVNVTKLSPGEADTVVLLTAGSLVTDDCPVCCCVLDLAGPLDWRGGTLSGTVKCQGGAVGVGSTSLSGGRLINAGQLVVSTPPGYGFYTGNGSVISNLAGATLAWNTDVGTTYQGGTAGTIFNQGRFTKSQGPGTALINDTVHNQGTGSIEAESGVLSLRNGGLNSGQNLATGSARLDFGGGTHTLDTSARLGGDGTIGCSAGTVDFSGSSAPSVNCLVNGGTFNCQSAIAPPFAVVTVSSGTLGGTGPVSAGSLDWRGGAIRGTVQCQGGSVGVGTTALHGRLINSGNLVVSTPPGYGFYTGSGSVISNLAGATLAWNTDVGTTYQGGSRGTIHNEGRFIKSSGAGTTAITDHFQSSGTVQVDTGTLSLATTSTLSGRCVANGTAILDFPAGTHALAGCTLAGSGTVRFSGGRMNVTKLSPGEADTVVLLTAGSLVTDDCPVCCCVLDLAGPLDWRGGTISGTVKCQGGAVGVGSTSLSGGRLINAGRLVVSTPLGYGFYTGNGSVISNLAGATLAWNTDVGTTYQGGTAGTIFNQGRFTKSQGPGTALINDTVHNQGTGSIEAESGVLSLRNGGLNSGQNLATGSARLDFGGGTHTLDTSARLGGDGTIGCSAGTVDFRGSSAPSVNCLVNGGTFNCQSAIATPFAVATVSSGTLGGIGPVSAGSLDWRGGAIRGTVQCQGGSVGVGTTALHGRLINSGNLVVSTPPGYGFYTGNGSVISNLAGATLAWNTDVGTTYQGGARGTIRNEGWFIKQTGTGTTTIADNLDNVGSVEVRSGTLSFSQPYVQTAGATRLLGGRLNVAAGMTLNGGVLSGTDTLVGRVVSRGRVTPGASPGLLTIEGDYTQLDEGILEIELGGTTVGTGYDRLAVTGATALAGMLRIVVVEGFVPPPDTVFEFLTMTSNRGDFQTIECPTCPSGSMTSFAETGAALITGPAEDAPQLTITRAAPDAVLLSWPRQAEGWVLEHTDQMPGASGPWPPVQQPYQTGATTISVFYPLPSDSGTVFFRLRKDTEPAGQAGSAGHGVR